MKSRTEVLVTFPLSRSIEILDYAELCFACRSNISASRCSNTRRNKINEEFGDWERIKKFELTPEIWSIENGLLTPTMKLKRKSILEKFIQLKEKRGVQ